MIGLDGGRVGVGATPVFLAWRMDGGTWQAVVRGSHTVEHDLVPDRELFSACILHHYLDVF